MTKIKKENMRALLGGGDRRSLGRAAEAIVLVRRSPNRLGELFACLWEGDPRVRMRAADALEKISREKGGLLQRYKAELLGLLAEEGQQEVRWHLALMTPRLRLTAAECERVADNLQRYLEDRSSIVKTLAMQGLADLTQQSPGLRPRVTELIRELTRTGTAAMRARGRKLLKRLEAEAVTD
ncbi:MAG TPA: hypothetical protein VEH49_06880 [Methylomirabilota bacterium]|nr:hypothetical protein [Methylomirabilota bacterium]